MRTLYTARMEINFKPFLSSQNSVLIALLLVLNLVLSNSTSPFNLLQNPAQNPSSLSQAGNVIGQDLQTAQPQKALAAKLVESYGKQPLSFEINQGQLDDQVKFFSRGSGYSFFLTGLEAVFSLGKPKPSQEKTSKTSKFDLIPGKETETVAQEPAQAEPPAIVRMKPVGANSNSVVVGEEEQAGKSNYFIGNDASRWQTNVSHFSRVRYKEVYPGIDMVYYGNSQGQLEYDFVLAPGADPSLISVNFEGVDRLETNEQGDLVLHLATGDLIQHAPQIYQESQGVKKSLASQYRLSKNTANQVSFEVESYDKNLPLVIDPTLVYSTFLGGSDNEQGSGITVDSAGNAYITGYTYSSNFPTQNPFQPALDPNVGDDAFVTKLNASGNGLVYSTFLGGSNQEEGYGIAIDSAGNAYITGYTYSSNFPTQNPFQPALGGGGADADAFVTKLNATGNALVYSTFLGGNNYDYGLSIAVDSAGNAYITGYTDSSNFPTQNPFQPALGGGADAFVTKLNASGNALLYSTYLGGNSGDFGQSIAVDSAGNAYITGQITSSNFPTQNPFQPALSGGVGDDAFVTKLNASGNGLVYSTYLGGTGDDFSTAIAIDSAGNAYITGYTYSSNFPTQNPFQPALGGNSDAFVTKLNASGTALLYSTYLGGSSKENGYGIAIDSAGNAYITGGTDSSNFPTQNPFQPALGGGGADAFVTKLNASGNALLYSTYLGGNSGDFGSAIAADSNGNVYITGGTNSSNFPTQNAFQPAYGGGNINYSGDAFATKLGIKTCLVNNTSDNAATANSLRNALLQSPKCDIINFNFSVATTITVTGTPLPAVPVGVVINGVCSSGQPIVTIDGTGITGTGLNLSGGNSVNCLKIQKFNGVQLKAVGGNGSNKLVRVVITKS